MNEKLNRVFRLILLVYLVALKRAGFFLCVSLTLKETYQNTTHIVRLMIPLGSLAHSAAIPWRVLPETPKTATNLAPRQTP
jgi:hypothetical protein